MSIVTDVVVRSTSVADPPMYDETLLSHQQAMLDACHSGNLEKLQQLFFKHNIKQGEFSSQGSLDSRSHGTNFSPSKIYTRNRIAVRPSANR